MKNRNGKKPKQASQKHNKGLEAGNLELGKGQHQGEHHKPEHAQKQGEHQKGKTQHEEASKSKWKK